MINGLKEAANQKVETTRQKVNTIYNSYIKNGYLDSKVKKLGNGIKNKISFKKSPIFLLLVKNLIYLITILDKLEILENDIKKAYGDRIYDQLKGLKYENISEIEIKKEDQQLTVQKGSGDDIPEILFNSVASAFLYFITNILQHGNLKIFDMLIEIIFSFFDNVNKKFYIISDINYKKKLNELINPQKKIAYITSCIKLLVEISKIDSNFLKLKELAQKTKLNLPTDMKNEFPLDVPMPVPIPENDEQILLIPNENFKSTTLSIDKKF
jgi:hypothetical protein